MGLGNISPRRCNQVCPDTRLRRVVAVTYLVSKHSKDLDGWELMILKAIANAKVGAVGHPVLIEGIRPGVGNVSSGDSCPRSTDITDEVTALGG